jgi:hypothetical protein
MKTIRVAIPKTVSKNRINNAMEALERHSVNIKYDGQHIIFDVSGNTTDEHICQLGMLIGITLCKMF